MILLNFFAPAVDLYHCDFVSVIFLFAVELYFVILVECLPCLRWICSSLILVWIIYSRHLLGMTSGGFGSNSFKSAVVRSV